MNYNKWRIQSHYKVYIDKQDIGIATVHYKYPNNVNNYVSLLSVHIIFHPGILSVPNVAVDDDKQEQSDFRPLTSQEEEPAVELIRDLTKKYVRNHNDFNITIAPLRQVFNVIATEDNVSKELTLVYENSFVYSYKHLFQDSTYKSANFAWDTADDEIIFQGYHF